MSNQQLKTVQPIVTINAEDHCITTSINVADVFQKGHNEVAKSIRKLEVPEKFHRENFYQSDYVNSRGKTYPMFEMTQRGFTMLVFSFTGELAMFWKLAFIEEFFRMRQQLEIEMQNKSLTMENDLRSEIMARDGRNFWLQDENSRLKSIMWKQTQKEQRKGTRVTPEENLEIKKLYDKGICKAEIGRRTGRSPSVINRAINMSVSEAISGHLHAV